MIRNYFFLNRFVVEANEVLKGSTLTSIFSQDKDILVIELALKNSKYFLEISVNPGFPFIALKEKFNRAKKNTIDFFEEVVNSKFLSMEISDSDRIIKINSANGSLYFLIRGKYTNVCFINKSNKVIYFENPPVDNKDEILLTELSELKFIQNFNTNLKFSLEETFDSLQKKYPFLGKEIISEVKVRCKNENSKELITKTLEVINEIKDKEVTVFLDEDNNKIFLGIITFHIFENTSKVKCKNVISGINYFISKRYFYNQIISNKKRIQKHIEKELTRLTSKLNKLKSNIERGSKEKEYNKAGNLLLINLAGIHHGMKNIEVIDIYNDNIPIKIKLNESLSPKKNVDYYFDKSRSEKIKFEKSKQLYKVTSEQFQKIKKLEEKFVNSKELEDYKEIMKELKINDNKTIKHDQDNQFNFKQYIIESKYHVFVGKDSKNNDLLTTKFAKQNDYWFHARSVPGSHVVLRIDNSKESIPKSILKKAASLAAYHSKAKTAGLVPVSYTQKKYVVKKKGMEAGKVALLREEVLIVKPEIPANCEYVLKE